MFVQYIQALENPISVFSEENRLHDWDFFPIKKNK